MPQMRSSAQGLALVAIGGAGLGLAGRSRSLRMVVAFWLDASCGHDRVDGRVLPDHLGAELAMQESQRGVFSSGDVGACLLRPEFDRSFGWGIRDIRDIRDDSRRSQVRGGFSVADRSVPSATGAT
jgi:hypothetical protein